jgi:hypothetical protein
MKVQVIQLEPYDDVISIRDRLGFIDTERVLLIWPPRGRVVKRKLDLVLIQREATRRGAKLALVTTHPEVIDYADELDISAFPSINESQQGRWKRPKNKVFIDRSDRPDNAPDPYELRLAASRLLAMSPEQRRFRRFTRIVAVVLLAFAILATALVLVPSAEITLTPAQAQISTTVRITADPKTAKVNVETSRIPASIVEIDIQTQASIPTTGSSDVPNTLASGIVLFTNQTGSPVFIPAETVVTTPGVPPVRYRTTADVTVEAGVGQTVEATVEATQDSGGPVGNVAANLIINVEGPLEKSLSVRNPEGMRGGTIRQQGIVTKADWDNLLILAREKIRQKALGEFSPKLTGTQFIVPASIGIIEERPEWTSYSAFVGDPADSLTLTLRARVQALVVDEQLARQATFANLTAKLPAGWQIVPETVSFTRGPLQNADAQGQVAFLMSASANDTVMISAERVRQRLAGSTLTEAINILQREWLLDPRRPPELKVWPTLFGRIPLLPIRIDVRVG